MRASLRRALGQLMLRTSCCLLAAIAGGSLLALPGCKRSAMDGAWVCEYVHNEVLDFHKGSLPYSVHEQVRVVIDGERLEFVGKRPLTMRLEVKAREGRKTYVNATLSATGLAIKPESAAFLFELSDDDKTLTIRELKDVDWSNPGRAKTVHPSRCTRD